MISGTKYATLLFATPPATDDWSVPPRDCAASRFCRNRPSSAAGDTGGFERSSDLIWRAPAGFGWHFNACRSAFIGYRAVGTDHTQGGLEWDVNTHRAIIGLELAF